MNEKPTKAIVLAVRIARSAFCQSATEVRITVDVLTHSGGMIVKRGVPFCW